MTIEELKSESRAKVSLPKIIVSFSGGKDSTWMLLEMMRRKEQIDEVVFLILGGNFRRCMNTSPESRDMSKILE